MEQRCRHEDHCASRTRLSLADSEARASGCSVAGMHAVARLVGIGLAPGIVLRVAKALPKGKGHLCPSMQLSPG